jgi:hypothetical protein
MPQKIGFEKALKLLQNNQQPLMGTDGILTP